MIKDRIVLDLPFKVFQMGRLDTIINEKIRAHGLEKGVVMLSAPEGVIFTTIEYEQNLVEDFKEAYDAYDKHIKDRTNRHILERVRGNTFTVPFNMYRLVIGDWQQVVLFTTRAFANLTIEMEIVPSHSILGMENISTTAELQTLDITDIVERTLTNIDDGFVTLVCPEPSVIMYTLNPQVFTEFIDFLIQLAPANHHYRHDHAWVKSIGYIHIRASFICQILTLSVRKGGLNLGDDRLYFTELDKTGAKRDIYFEVWK